MYNYIYSAHKLALVVVTLHVACKAVDIGMYVTRFATSVAHVILVCICVCEVMLSEAEL